MQTNKQNKASWFFRAALLLLCLVLVTALLVAGMLARYVSSSDGDTGARVAYFDVTLTSVNDGNDRNIDCAPNSYDSTKIQDFTLTVTNGTTRPAEVTTQVDVYVTLSRPLVRELEMTLFGFKTYSTVTSGYNNSDSQIRYTSNGDGSVTYCFKNAVTFTPGTAQVANFTLRFYASTNAVQAVNAMQISVYAVGTQLD